MSLSEQWSFVDSEIRAELEDRIATLESQLSRAQTAMRHAHRELTGYGLIESSTVATAVEILAGGLLAEKAHSLAELKLYTRQEVYNLIEQAQVNLTNMDPDEPTLSDMAEQFQGLYGAGVDPEAAYIADFVWRKNLEDQR